MEKIIYKKIYESGLITAYINLKNTIENLINKGSYKNDLGNDNILIDEQIEILEIIKKSIENRIENL